MNCQDFNIMIKLSDFLNFNEIWQMFPPNPMYETNAIPLHFLLWFFWYILVLAFSPGLFPFSVPGLLDFFSTGTTGPRDLQGL